MKTLSGKPPMLKAINSSMIEQLVFESGPLSKPELAKRSGLSLVTTGKLVDDLVKHKRLCPAGQRGTSAGRKAMFYETNRNSGCILACYYKEGSFLCRLADMLNNTLYENSFPLDAGSIKKSANSTFHAIDSLMQQAPAQVKIIGIGLPGVVQPDGHLLAIPQIAVWEGFNLEKTLRSRYKAEIYVENDVNLSAMGYFCTNVQKNQNNLIYLYVGNSIGCIGCGIILNRQLFRGSGNFSGEIGFMTETTGSAQQDYLSGGGYMETHMGSLLYYKAGKPRRMASREREKLIAILSTIAVNHITVVNPGLIVFAGHIFDKNLIEAIRQRMTHYLPAQAMPRLSRDLNTTTGMDGLVESCRRFISTGIHLVQSTGLS